MADDLVARLWPNAEKAADAMERRLRALLERAERTLRSSNSLYDNRLAEDIREALEQREP